MARIKQGGQSMRGTGGGWHRLTFHEPGWIEFHRETGSLRTQAGKSSMSMTGMLVPDAPNFMHADQKQPSSVMIGKLPMWAVALNVLSMIIFFITAGLNLKQAYTHYEATHAICSQKLPSEISPVKESGRKLCHPQPPGRRETLARLESCLGQLSKICDVRRCRICADDPA